VARILVVDDEETDRTFQQVVLEGAGHEIFIAEDGGEALRAYAGRGIEVVLTDLQMPKVHGLELIMALREFSPRPVIIAISGTGAPQLAMAHALGAERTLTKPVDPDELIAAVAETLAERAASGTSGGA
jgi:CheY-like chemotaxis protein